MNTVCFNDSNNIIGFNLSDSIDFINLFDIDNVTKDYKEYEEVPVKDSLGRKIYKIIDETTQSYSITSDIENINKNFKIEQLMTPMIKNNTVYLLSDIDKFSIDDILIEKENQLKQKYNCSDCILYELLDEDSIQFNTDSGKNIMKIYPQKEIISNQIKIKNASQISVYYECDADLDIEISSNKKSWTRIEKGEFVDFNNKILYIKFISNIEADIYSVSILIN